MEDEQSNRSGKMGRICFTCNDDADLSRKIHQLENSLQTFRAEVNMKLGVVEQILNKRNEQIKIQQKLLHQEQSLYQTILSHWKNVADMAANGFSMQFSSVQIAEDEVDSYKIPNEICFTNPITQKPSSNVAQKPSSNVAQKPSSNVAQKPSSNVAQKPSSNVAQKPSSNVAQKPSSNVAQKPSSNVAQKPSSNVARRLLNNKLRATLPSSVFSASAGRELARRYQSKRRRTRSSDTEFSVKANNDNEDKNTSQRTYALSDEDIHRDEQCIPSSSCLEQDQSFHLDHDEADDKDCDEMDDDDTKSSTKENKLFVDFYRPIQDGRSSNNNPIWKYFLREESGNSGLCKACQSEDRQTIVKMYKTSSSSLPRHLKVAHSELYEEYIESRNCTSIKATRKGVGNRTGRLQPRKRNSLSSDSEEEDTDSSTNENKTVYISSDAEDVEYDHVPVPNPNGLSPRKTQNQNMDILDVASDNELDSIEDTNVKKVFTNFYRPSPDKKTGENNPIWKFFFREDSGNSGLCKECKSQGIQTIVKTSERSSSNLTRHLKTQHPHIYEECLKLRVE